MAALCMRITLLIYEGFEITSGIEILGVQLENLMIYSVMIFALMLGIAQMRYDKNIRRFLKSRSRRRSVA